MPTTTLLEFSPAVASLQARTDAAGAAITDVSGEELRLYASIFSAGVVNADDYQVVPGAGLSVDVGIGDFEDLCVVPGIAAGQGNYLVRMGTAPKNVPLTAADLTNPRIDQVYVVVSDHAYDASGRVIARIGYRKGDAAASPVAPGVDAAWKAYLLLATIAVGAGVTSITGGNITDNRVRTSVSLGGLQPTGAVTAFAGSSAPAGWLLCDGAAISRTTYAGLFAVCGVTYGAGDGSTTFNLPDLRQRFPLGKAASGTGNALGATGGAIDHTHTGPSHTHTGPSHGHTAPDHVHSNPWTSLQSNHQHTMSSGTGLAGDHTHPIPNTSSVGLSTGGPSSTLSNVSTAGSGFPASQTHTHSISGHSHTIAAAGTDGNHTHGVFISDGAGEHQHTIADTGVGGSQFSTGASGTGATSAGGTSNTGLNNPPYLVLNWIIKT